jgi:hypothetical protein
VTSIDIERIFSKGCLLLSHICNQLTVDTTQVLLCLGTWSKLGFVNKEDLLAATLLPELKEGGKDVPDGFDLIL